MFRGKTMLPKARCSLWGEKKRKKRLIYLCIAACLEGGWSICWGENRGELPGGFLTLGQSCESKGLFTLQRKEGWGPEKREREGTSEGTGWASQDFQMPGAYSSLHRASVPAELLEMQDPVRPSPTSGSSPRWVAFSAYGDWLNWWPLWLPRTAIYLSASQPRRLGGRWVVS